MTSRTYSRVGLMGNPSDGFYGKTISLTIKNFWAEATISKSPRLRLCSPNNDSSEFGSLFDLHGISQREGYDVQGGLRLLQATCKRFYQYCTSQPDIAVRTRIVQDRRNFTLSYITTIPQQVGLAGSSAIITATLKCLMIFFNIDIPINIQAQIALDVEKLELSIQAGLQDRVIQLYEGLMYMDFSNRESIEGTYEQLDVSLDQLPQLWLAYCADPSDSGMIHSNIRQRWDNGEQAIIQGMKKFAELTDRAKSAILTQNYQELASLMDENCMLRRELYTDAVIGEDTIKMINIAREYGSAVKLSGSGGAVVGLCMDQFRKAMMVEEYHQQGYKCCDIQPYFP